MGSVHIICNRCDKEKHHAFGTGFFPNSFCDCNEPELIMAGVDTTEHTERFWPRGESYDPEDNDD